VHASKNNTYTTRLVLGGADQLTVPEGCVSEELDSLDDLVLGQSEGHEAADEAGSDLPVGDDHAGVVDDVVDVDGSVFADVESNGRDNSHAYLH
jgi:hypothetical protein